MQIDGGGQGVVGAADNHGVGKVGDGLDEGDQKGVAQAGQEQREGDCGKDLPPAGPHVPGGLLQGGVYVFQQALEHHVTHWEEGKGLDNHDAPEAIDAVVIDFKPLAGNNAGLAEEHNHGQRKDEGRRNHR